MEMKELLWKCFCVYWCIMLCYQVQWLATDSFVHQKMLCDYFNDHGCCLRGFLESFFDFFLLEENIFCMYSHVSFKPCNTPCQHHKSDHDNTLELVRNLELNLLIVVCTPLIVHRALSFGQILCALLRTIFTTFPANAADVLEKASPRDAAVLRHSWS